MADRLSPTPAPGARGLALRVVIGTLDVGGTERHLLAVLPRLREHGIEPELIVLGGRGTLAPRFEAAGIAVRSPPLVRSLASWPRALRRGAGAPLALAAVAGHLLAGARPRIVHCFLPEAYLVGGLAAVLTGARPRVMSRRSLAAYQGRYPMLARLERWLHRRMDRVCGNSRAVLDELAAEGVDPERLVLVPNGVDLAPFEAAAGARDGAREALGVPSGTVAFVCVANLIPYKGHVDLLRALAGARERLPPWVLLCAGRDQGLGQALLAEARSLGLAQRVRLLGERADVPRLLAAADVAVLASHEEGSPNAVLEAMAAARPVVATRVGGTPELVADGETGRLVAPGSPPALGEALAELACDAARRAAMGRAGRRRAEREFSLERCVRCYVSLYRSLAGVAGPARPRRCAG